MIKSASSPSLSSMETESAPTKVSRLRSSAPALHNRAMLSHAAFGAPVPGERRRHIVPAVAALPYWTEVPQLASALEHELELESSLHVTGFTAAQCEVKFGFQELPSNLLAQDSLKHAASDGSHAEQGVERVSSLQHARSLGACLATPIEGAQTVSRVRIQDMIRGTVASQMRDDVAHCVDRWSDWARKIRRIRRKNRLERLQAILSMLAAPAS